MKNNKSLKILVAVLSAALLVGAAFATLVSAQGDAPVIVSKNVSYEGALHLYYAIPVTDTVKAENTVVNIYSSNPETNANAEKIGSFTGEETYINVLGGNFIEVRTQGIPAKDIAKYVYAQPVSGGVAGKVIRYSVAEYLYERLYVSENSTDLQKKLYNTTLQYGIDAQAVLDASATPIANYNYVYAYDATIDSEGNNSGLYLAGESVNLTYKGDGNLAVWNLKTLNAEGAFVESVLTENSLEVSATTLVSPSLYDLYTPVDKGEVFNSAFADSAKENVTMPDINNVKYNSKIFANKGTTGTYSDVKLGIVADPKNADNNVLRLSKDNVNKDYANASAFNTNLYIKSTDKVTDYDLIIFDADLYFDYADNSPSRIYSLKLENGEWDSSTTGVDITLGTTETNMSVYLRGDGVSTEYTPVAGVAAEEAWFNIRVEYYIIDKEANSTRTKVYINGNLVKNETYTASATPLYNVNTAQFVSDSKSYGDFYMDNVVFERTSVEYEIENSRPAYTFDGDTLPEGVTTGGWLPDGSSASKGTTAIENGQLVLKSVQGYNDSITFRQTEAAPENANTVVWSADVKNIAYGDGAGAYSELTFKDSTGATFRFNIMLRNKNGADVYFKSYARNPKLEYSNTGAISGTSFNLRLEYYIDASSAAKVDIYVNNIFLGTMDDSKEGTPSVADMDRFTFTCRDGDAQDVYFDNVRLYKINKAR